MHRSQKTFQEGLHSNFYVILIEAGEAGDGQKHGCAADLPTAFTWVFLSPFPKAWLAVKGAEPHP